MPKRFSSTHGWLGFALALARAGRYQQAQLVLKKVAARDLTASDLRTIAQVNSRCELLDAAEACWLEIVQHHTAEPGDYYMLGSLQSRLSKLELAARSFEHEIAVATATGTTYFLGSSQIRLADLMLRLDQPLRAKEVLASVGEDVGDYIDNAGFRTKVAILHEANLRTQSSDK